MASRERLQRRDVRELLVTICECLQDAECCPKTEGAGDVLDGTLSALARFDAWKSMPAAGLRSVVSDRLVFWNEHEEAGTREFWKRVKDKGLPFKRRDIVREVIKRGRIRDMSEFELVVDEIGTSVRDSRLSLRELKALTKLVEELEAGRSVPRRRRAAK